MYSSFFIMFKNRPTVLLTTLVGSIRIKNTIFHSSKLINDEMASDQHLCLFQDLLYIEIQPYHHLLKERLLHHDLGKLHLFDTSNHFLVHDQIHTHRSEERREGKE